LGGEGDVVEACDREAGEVGGVKAGCTYDGVDFCFFAIFAISRYDGLLVGQNPFVLMGQTSSLERIRTYFITLAMLL
jgi:hypothetical protein